MESERLITDARNEVFRLCHKNNIMKKTFWEDLTPYNKRKLKNGGRIPPLINGNIIIYKNSAKSKCYNNQGKIISGESKIKPSSKNTLEDIYQKLLENGFTHEDICENIGFHFQIVNGKPKWIPYPETDKYSSYDENGNKLNTLYPKKKENDSERFIVTFY